MKNEADVKKLVKKKLIEYKDRGLWYFMPPANGYGRAGIPDFVGCYKGNMFAIETKFGANDLSANQVREIGDLQAADAMVWIVRDTTIGEWANEFEGWAALCS